MKNASIMLGFAAALTAASVVPQASAEQVYNETIPFNWSYYSQCTNELISASGTYHILQNITYGGNTFHVTFRYNLQGSGEGLTTGTKYRISQNDGFSFNKAAGFNDTRALSFRLKAQGGAADLVVHGLWHITVNANGSVTSSVGDYSFECR